MDVEVPVLKQFLKLEGLDIDNPKVELVEKEKDSKRKDLMEVEEVSEKNVKPKVDKMESQDDSMSCSVCLAEKKSILLLPCKHVCLCSGCGEKVSDCPLCRTKIEAKQTIFL